MLRLGQSIKTYDPAEALKDEYGTFRVMTPNNEELLITCKPGHSISNVQTTTRSGAWLVTKISEPVFAPGEENHPQAAV
jgi:hypothetical protein